MASSLFDIPEIFGCLIGKPFRLAARGPDEYDCWGLLAAGLWLGWQIAVPAYVEGYDADGVIEADARRFVRQEHKTWRRVPDRSAIRAGDAVTTSNEGRLHVGLLIAPRAVLHTRSGSGSGWEPLDSIFWRHRAKRIYRHERLAGHAVAPRA